MRVPDVTVVIAVYNGLPYFRRCLESVSRQTLGPGRLEAVVVDDGSTDGSGRCAEEFAASAAMPVRVVRQTNSGGPSRPRNTGLDMARGRYVFFLDADDYLGDEALERMTAAADRNGTDVVLGRITGINRKAPQSMFTADTGRTDICSSRVMNTMSAEKLFRRELLERHGMRFIESLHHGEDSCFTLEAYVRADGISVVASYPCLYIVGRTDGRNLSLDDSTTQGFTSARTQLELIERLVPPGKKRDMLLVRPLRMKILRRLGPRMRKEPEEIWQRCLSLAAPLVEQYATPGVMARLRAHERLRMHCIREGRSDLLKDVLTLMASAEKPEGSVRPGEPVRTGEPGEPGRGPGEGPSTAVA